LFRFFSNLIPAYVIERLFWEERGMTIQLVVYTEIIFALTVVLLEIPTGVMSDRWGRKNMLILSAVLGCCEFLFLLFANRFWHFAGIVFLAGIARSLSSGSEDALLYESLKQQGSASDFERQLGRLNFVDLTASILAALSGGWLASRFELELNYRLSLLSAAAALIIAFLLKEPLRTESGSAEADEKIPFVRYVKDAIHFFRARPTVCWVVFSGMVCGAALGYIYEFWQLYADRLGIPVVLFGWLSTSLMLLQMPGNLLAHWLARQLPYRFLIIAILSIFTCGFAWIASSRSPFGLIAMLVVCLSAGVMSPLVTGYLHHRIESGARATIGSFQSLGENLVHILTGLGFGFFASRFDVFGGYGFIACLCGAFTAWYAASTHRWKDRAQGTIE
jgi:predicted MFS family arabinose efflux permease